ncbi:hypothetical protein C8T65DRAFT_649242 [Cerioporus squamosus]|nr:hypothetical protein C8T65DRAFT_649242 [Cerioporus squamosus]
MARRAEANSGATPKRLGCDRILAVDEPAGHWIWPLKHRLAKYQAYKGRSYMRKGQAILDDAMQKSPQFRKGPAPELKKTLERYRRDLETMYQSGNLDASTLRRWKHGTRENMVNIVLSSEAISASEDCYMPVGSVDDSGMPSALASVPNSPWNSPPVGPRCEMLESVRQFTSLGELALQLQQLDPFNAPENTVGIEMVPLDATTHGAEESPAVPPGVHTDGDAVSRRGLLSPSGSVAVAA